MLCTYTLCIDVSNLHTKSQTLYWLLNMFTRCTWRIYILLLCRRMNVFIYSVMSSIHLIGHAYIFQELGYISYLGTYGNIKSSPGPRADS